MNMPTTVKVGPHVYSILRKPAKSMGENFGHCNWNAVQIEVRRGIRKSKAKETLVHEIIHACTHPALSYDDSNKKYTIEELILVLAPAMLEVLQDNPELVEYLTK